MKQYQIYRKTQVSLYLLELNQGRITEDDPTEIVAINHGSLILFWEMWSLECKWWVALNI